MSASTDKSHESKSLDKTKPEILFKSNEEVEEPSGENDETVLASGPRTDLSRIHNKS